jgi:four helix bundle protein
MNVARMGLEKVERGYEVSWYPSCEALEVYRLAFDASMTIFEMTREMRGEEHSTFIKGIVTASRSVCYYIAEAIRKHHSCSCYLERLRNAKEEAEETLTWIRVAAEQEYVEYRQCARLYLAYRSIITKLESLLTHPAPIELKIAA